MKRLTVDMYSGLVLQYHDTSMLRLQSYSVTNVMSLLGW